MLLCRWITLWRVLCLPHRNILRLHWCVFALGKAGSGSDWVRLWMIKAWIKACKKAWLVKWVRVVGCRVEVEELPGAGRAGNANIGTDENH